MIDLRCRRNCTCARRARALAVIAAVMPLAMPAHALPPPLRRPSVTCTARASPRSVGTRFSRRSVNADDIQPVYNARCCPPSFMESRAARLSYLRYYCRASVLRSRLRNAGGVIDARTDDHDVAPPLLRVMPSLPYLRSRLPFHRRDLRCLRPRVSTSTLILTSPPPFRAARAAVYHAYCARTVVIAQHLLHTHLPP